MNDDLLKCKICRAAGEGRAAWPQSDGPRSQNDYIELAREFHAVLISNVPQLGRETDDQTRRFINLVDEFYDRKVKLVITAAAPIHEIYTGGGLDFEIERTQSRLLEMQSQEYLATEHKS